jgi:hypothetical protein
MVNINITLKSYSITEEFDILRIVKAVIIGHTLVIVNSEGPCVDPRSWQHHVSTRIPAHSAFGRIKAYPGAIKTYEFMTTHPIRPWKKQVLFQFS